MCTSIHTHNYAHTYHAHTCILALLLEAKGEKVLDLLGNVFISCYLTVRIACEVFIWY